MSHPRVAIGVDDSDHMAFLCPQCRAVMKVTSVQTTGVLRNIPTQPAVTHVYLQCKCGQADWRKFYWLAETGKYCTHRTDGQPMSEPLPVLTSGPITRKEIIEGLRELYTNLVEYIQEEDPTFAAYPDLETILDHIEQHGLPAKEGK